MTDEPMFSVTGRPMTGQLERALDQVGARDRKLMAAALMQQEGQTGPLLRAVALELQLVGLREDAIIAATAADLIASDGPEPPFPASPPSGLEMWYDPTTGEFTATPPGGGSV